MAGKIFKLQQVKYIKQPLGAVFNWQLLISGIAVFVADEIMLYNIINNSYYFIHGIFFKDFTY